MDETMVKNWNNVVGPSDYVYHLGDVFLGGSEKWQNELLWSLNGQKRLIVGNHDKLKSKVLQNGFEKIEYWKGFSKENFTCTHVPHELGALRDGAYNVHGHIHNNLREDSHYINVCVEHTQYTPIHMDTILEEIKQRES